MPQYNDKPSLSCALDAILSLQDYFCEIIICDDCSTDDSWDLLQEYASRYPVIRLIRNSRNQGVLMTLDRLLSEAKGEYVVMPAADDIWIPENMKKLLEAIPIHPECQLFCGQNLVNNRVTNTQYNYSYTFRLSDGKHEAHSISRFYRWLPWGPAGVIFRDKDRIRSLLKKLAYLKCHADGIAALIYAEQAPFYYSSQPVAMFTVDGNQFSAGYNNKQYQFDFFTHLFKILKSDYLSLYSQMAAANLFYSYPWVSSFLICHPGVWDRHTVRIIISCNHLFTKFRYSFLPGLFSENFKHKFRKFRNLIFGIPRDYPAELDNKQDTHLK